MYAKRYFRIDMQNKKRREKGKNSLFLSNLDILLKYFLKLFGSSEKKNKKIKKNKKR